MDWPFSARRPIYAAQSCVSLSVANNRLGLGRFLHLLPLWPSKSAIRPEGRRMRAPRRSERGARTNGVVAHNTQSTAEAGLSFQSRRSVDRPPFHLLFRRAGVRGVASRSMQGSSLAHMEEEPWKSVRARHKAPSSCGSMESHPGGPLERPSVPARGKQLSPPPWTRKGGPSCHLAPVNRKEWLWGTVCMVPEIPPGIGASSWTRGGLCKCGWCGPHGDARTPQTRATRPHSNALVWDSE